MKWVIKLFLMALKLYAQQSLARFGQEMEEVFRAGLEEAREQGMVAGFILHEILRLPGSLAGVYVWSMRAGEGRQMAVSSADGGGTIGGSMPGDGWGGSLLAGYRHQMMGTFLVMLELIRTR